MEHEQPPVSAFPANAPQVSRLEVRVAQILNARELVINLGAQAGVRVGMRFSVLADQPLQILDPETREVLDTVDREKTRVEVTEVRPRIAVCKTFRIIQTPGVRLRAFAGLFQEAEERPETLHVRDASLPPPLPEDQSYVKVNDRVIGVSD